ncbi:MAG TPA: PP2C family protein-serine/threonine phosphatase [Actinophytocola sp.]|uniref:PP2C family protein-serine/threonine phosphatase n=1 Tax=Actinophytocola sp. TaxID=1872138 RepID=UPI002E09546E|nr:PP2C family protein-serine/threonine phosphatase [Actinophytocola sp.]
MPHQDGGLRHLLDVVRMLGELALSSTVETLCARAVAAFRRVAADLPFGLIYLFDPDTAVARLAGRWGGEPPARFGAPAVVELAGPIGGSWPLGEVASLARTVLVPDPGTGERALVVPFGGPGAETLEGALVTGIGPQWAVDGDFRAVLQLMAAQLGCALTATRARVAERDRAAALAELREVADAGHALTTSLDTEEIRRAVTDLVLPGHGLWCAVWLVRPDGDTQVNVRAAAEGHNGVLARVFGERGERVRALLGVDDCLSGLRTVTQPIEQDGWPDGWDRGVGRLAVTVPMPARGRVVGAITFGRAEQRVGEIGDLYYLEELARRAALAFDNAAMHAAEQRIALGLQRSLLPRALPEVPEVRLAARYLPGSRGARVGGDWYDTVSLAAGRLGLMIGDVVGHGVQAVARMGQLRTALRSYAVPDRSPAAVLEALDSFLLTGGEARFATCLYAVFQVRTGLLHVANAGHLSPLLLVPGEQPRFVHAGTGVPLGGASRLVPDGTAFFTRRLRMPPRSALVLYTDGVVEGRGETLESGPARLRAALRGEFSSAEEICDRALGAMELGETGRDDATLLVMQRT